MADWETAPTAAAPETWESAPPKGKPTAANAGLANLMAGVAGLPVDTAMNVANLGIAGYGMIRGAVTGDPGASPEPLNPAQQVGSSAWIKEKMRSTGMPGISPDNPDPKDDFSTLQYDFVSRGGVLPHGAAPAIGSIVAERALGPQYAPLGAMAPSVLTSVYNSVRAPRLERERVHNQVRDESLAAGQREGYKVVPSQVQGGGFVNNRVEGVGGKAALNQQATAENQMVTDNLARRAAGLPPDARLTPETLAARRDTLAQPYREVSSLSTLASNTLQRLRDARANARAQWDHYDRQRVPEAQRLAQQYDQQASTLERVLEREAQRHGRPDLIPQLRESRTGIARTFDVERALNRGDGHVDAHDLARAFDRGAPFTGELRTIARFAQAFPQVTRPSARNPTPGVGALESNAGAGLALMGQASGTPAGFLAGGIPFLGTPARNMLLSDIYQSRFARPDYGPATIEIPTQSLGRVAIMENDMQARK